MLIKVEGDKTNFIDSQDHFIGFDTGQDCCEHAGWFISDKKENYDTGSENEGDRGFNVEGFNFVPGAVTEVTPDEDAGLDYGGMVIFTLRDEKGNELYLHLFNCHNGYYGHGVETNVATLENDTL